MEEEDEEEEKCESYGVEAMWRVGDDEQQGHKSKPMGFAKISDRLVPR